MTKLENREHVLFITIETRFGSNERVFYPDKKTPALLPYKALSRHQLWASDRPARCASLNYLKGCYIG